MLLHVFKAGNGNKCITYFLSGEIKELKKKKEKKGNILTEKHEIVTDNPAKVMEIFLQSIGTFFLWDYQNKEEFPLQHTVVPLFVATYYKATILGSIIVYIINPSREVTRLVRPDFPFPNGGLIRGGPLYM